MTDYQPFYNNSYALVIGINSYSDRRFAPLGEAENDAKAMADLLVEPRYGFTVKTLLGAEATQASILEALFGMQNTKADDRILVYFAGHGYTLSDRFGHETGYLATYDTVPERHYTALELEEMTDLRRRAGAKHIAFIFDACFSGQALGLTRAVSDESVEKFLTRRAYQVISAGAGDQTVSDFQSMTDVLIAKLRDDRVDTMNSLGLHVQQMMAAQSGKTQIPQFGHMRGSQGGDFVFEAEIDPDLIESIEQQPEKSHAPAAIRPTAQKQPLPPFMMARWLNIPVWGWVSGAIALVMIAIIIGAIASNGNGTPTLTPTATDTAEATGTTGPTDTAEPTITASHTPEDMDPTSEPTLPTDILEQFTLLDDVLTASGTWADTLTWQPAGNQIAAVLGDGNAARWRIGRTAPEQIYVPISGTDAIVDVAWGPDGRLAFSYDDERIDIWDPNRGRLGPFEDSQMLYVGDVEWSPTGDVLAAVGTRGASGQIRLWQVSGSTATRLDIREINVGPNEYTLSFSPDGTMIAGAFASRTGERVYIWRIEDGSQVMALEIDASFGMVTQTAWSPDGTYLAARINDPDSETGTINVFDASTGELVAALDNFRTAPALLSDMAWSPTDNLLAIAARSSGMHVWDVADERLRPLPGPGDMIISAAWSSYGEGSTLAGSTPNETVRLWDAP